MVCYLFPAVVVVVPAGMGLSQALVLLAPTCMSVALAASVVVKGLKHLPSYPTMVEVRLLPEKR